MKKNIPNYPKSYFACLNGDIISIKSGREKVMKPYKNRYGYLVVHLYLTDDDHNILGKQSEFFLVHRLIALAFIPNPENKPMVNHKNGIKHDNRVENLEWCTRSENTAHSFAIGTQTNKGENHPGVKLTTEKVLQIRDMAKTGQYSNHDLGLLFEVTRHCIFRIVTGKTWKHI